MTLYDRLNSLADLQSLIDADERESDILEYKTASKRLESRERGETAKDVSAFANAAGGLLVYGIATDKADKTKPIKLEPIDEWNVNYILHTISSAIRHPIAGIRSKTLPVGGLPQALLVDVPESPMAPHQVAGECRYYRRQGVESVPMTHDLVELYFGRKTQAVLEPVPSLWDVSVAGYLRRGRVVIAIRNAGGEIGRDVLTRILLPDPNRVVNLEGIATHISMARSVDMAGERGIAHQHIGELYYPGVQTRFVEFWLTMRTEALGREHVLFYFDGYAAGSRPRRYEIYLIVDSQGWNLRAEPGGAP